MHSSQWQIAVQSYHFQKHYSGIARSGMAAAVKIVATIKKNKNCKTHILNNPNSYKTLLWIINRLSGVKTEST